MNNHELQIVTIEQAKKLKELGFDWRVDLVFASETDHHNQTRKGMLYGTKGFRNSADRGDSDYAAPTVALALKWIMDDGRRVLYCIDYHWNKIWQFSWRFSHSKGDRQGYYYDTYEAAESALLDAILETMEGNDDQK